MLIVVQENSVNDSLWVGSINCESSDLFVGII